MIRTDTEHQKALEQLERDAETIEAQREHLQSIGLVGEQLDRAMQPMASFHEQLKDEVETYERMKRGDLGTLSSLTSIGRWLIGARIARGMTQKELADRLEVSESQVSRDERNEYHGITVDRAQRTMDALGIRFRAEAENPLLEEFSPEF
ncbi:MAG: helix-turn-helix transcriptional regulator [Rhodothermales bacterium]